MRYFLFITFCACCYITWGQQVYFNDDSLRMIWGEDVVNVTTGGTQQVSIIGKCDGDYYVLIGNQLEKYDTLLRFKKSKKLSLSYKNKPLTLEKIIASGDQLYVLSSFLNVKLNKKFLFVQTINKISLKLDSNLKKIAEIEIKSPFDAGRFEIKHNDAGQNLVYFIQPKNKRRISVLAYNKNFELEWKNEYQFRNNVLIEQILITKEHDVHVIGITYDLKPNKFKKYKDYNKYEYHILSFFDNGQVIKEHEINLGNKIITSAQMTSNNNQNLLLTGLYMDDEETEGVFFAKANKNSHQVVLEKFYNLGKSYFQEHIYEKGLSRGHPPIFDYVLKDVHVHENGSVSLITEQHYILEQMEHYPPSRVMLFYHHHYNDILLFHFGINGELLWDRSIKKHQYSRNDNGYFLSLSSFAIDDKIQIVYNDTRKNLNPENDKVFAFHNVVSNTVITSVSVDVHKGTIKKSPFTAQKKVDVLLVPKQSIVLDEHLFLLGKKGKHHRFVAFDKQ